MTQAVALTLLGLVELLVAAGLLLALLYRRYRRLRGTVALEAGRRAALLRWLDARVLSPGEGGSGEGILADGTPGCAEGDRHWLEIQDNLKRLLGSPDPYDPAAWGALLTKIAQARVEAPAEAVVSAGAPPGPEADASMPQVAGSDVGAIDRRGVVRSSMAGGPAGAIAESDRHQAVGPSGDWRTSNAVQDLRGQVEALTADKEHLLSDLRTAREAVQERENALRALHGRYEALQREYVAVFDRYAQEQPGKRAV